MKVRTMKVNREAAAEQARASSLRVLMTRTRRIEVGRILLTGLIDLIRERKVGTEIFVTVATLVAVFGGETVAGAVLMTDDLSKIVSARAIARRAYKKWEIGSEVIR